MNFYQVETSLLSAVPRRKASGLRFYFGALVIVWALGSQTITKFFLSKSTLCVPLSQSSDFAKASSDLLLLPNYDNIFLVEVYRVCGMIEIAVGGVEHVVAVRVV